MATKRYGANRAHSMAKQAKKAGYKAAGTRTKQGGSKKRMKSVSPTAGAKPVSGNATRGLGGQARQSMMDLRRGRQRARRAMGDAGLKPPRRRQ